MYTFTHFKEYTPLMLTQNIQCYLDTVLSSQTKFKVDSSKHSKYNLIFEPIK